MTHRDPKFIEMKKAGKSHREIGEAYGVNFRTVDRWASEAIKRGLLSPMAGRTPTEPTIIERLKDLWLTGVHIDDVAKTLNKTRSAIRGLTVRYGIQREKPVTKPYFWTDDKIAEVRRMREAGMVDTAIGAALGTTARSILRARITHKIDLGAPRAPVKTWTPAEEATLRKLWFSGLSCHLIGQQMGGRTANQIASKGKRMKLPDKGVPAKRKVADRDYKTVSLAASARKGTTLGPRAKPGPKEDPHIIPDFARPWLTRAAGECTYPYGERHNIHSCCKPVFGVSKWCEAHHALCTVERKVAA
jgi:hypothetical protein